MKKIHREKKVSVGFDSLMGGWRRIGALVWGHRQTHTQFGESDWRRIHARAEGKIEPVPAAENFRVRRRHRQRSANGISDRTRSWVASKNRFGVPCAGSRGRGERPGKFIFSKVACQIHRSSGFHSGSFDLKTLNTCNPADWLEKSGSPQSAGYLFLSLVFLASDKRGPDVFKGRRMTPIAGKGRGSFVLSG